MRLKDDFGNEIGQRQINCIAPALIAGGMMLAGQYMQNQQNQQAQAGANKINRQIAEGDRAEVARQFDTTAGINQQQFGYNAGLAENRYGYEQGAQNERGLDARAYMEKNLNPYTSAGATAQQAQLDMMGLGGAGSQERFQSMMNESPGQRFLRERQEKTLLRNQSAQGGLGSGGARRELAELGFNLAQTDMNNMYDRLGGIANRGFAGSQQLAGNAMGTAQTSTPYAQAAAYDPYVGAAYSAQKTQDTQTAYAPPPAPNVDPFWNSQVGGSSAGMGANAGGGGFGEGMGGGFGPSSSGMGGNF